jgi:hypothetical protein
MDYLVLPGTESYGQLSQGSLRELGFELIDKIDLAPEDPVAAVPVLLGVVAPQVHYGTVNVYRNLYPNREP